MHDEATRQRIRVTQLVRLLDKHAFGEVKMEATQIKAAEILLKKSLPDLSHSDIAMDPSANTLKVEITHFTKPLE